MGVKAGFVLSVFLVLSFLACGCQNTQSGGAAAGGDMRTPSDIRKAELLSRLDRKWENPDAHFELGQLYHADGLWSKAEYHYNIALGYDPVQRDAQAGMVKLMFDRGEKTKGQWAADMYMKQASSSADQLLLLGLGFQKQTLDDYALTCYKQALAMSPNSAKVNRQIGYYYLAKKNLELAKEYLARSFQLDSNQPDVAGELGRLGVAVQIPHQTQTNPKKLDRIIDQADKPSQ